MFCHNFGYWVFFSQFEFMNFVTTSIFEFCHHFSFGVLSQTEFWSFVTIWVLSQLKFFFSFPNNLKEDIISSLITFNIPFYFKSFITLFRGNILYFVTLNLKCHVIFCYISYFVKFRWQLIFSIFIFCVIVSSIK